VSPKATVRLFAVAVLRTPAAVPAAASAADGSAARFTANPTDGVLGRLFCGLANSGG
jgi:hypothetical protein